MLSLLSTGGGELQAGPVSCGPVPQLLPPVLDPGAAPAELSGTVQGRDGVGADGLPPAPGAASLSAVR